MSTYQQKKISSNIYSGKQFCSKYGNTFYKVLKKSLIHHNFKYNCNVINVDTVKFNPTGICLPGGLYFCTLENLPRFTQFGSSISRVYIPDDAIVYVDNFSFKTDKFILKNVECYDRFFSKNKQILIECLEHNPALIKYISNQTKEICLKTISTSALALQYIADQTNEICAEAVSTCSLALQYVKNQTHDICLMAVSINGVSLKYVQNPTKQLCLAALLNYCGTIEHVEEPVKKLCYEVAMENHRTAQNLDKRNLEIAIEYYRKSNTF